VAQSPTSAEIANTIAVMPFADMSPDGSQEYFGDGMAEEILNVISTIEELDVTSRTTAFSLKGEGLSIPEIAERLQVNYVLEGSVRSDGDFVRVTAQLIDVANDKHLWSDTFDRELKGIFAIQDEISLAIADVLKVELLGDQIGDIPTENMEAYDLYLRAIRKFDVPNWDKTKEAQELLNRAIELDPEFAYAWAALAGSYGNEITYGELGDSEIDQRLDLAIDAAQRATLLDPTLLTAWSNMGWTNLQRLDWEQAKVFLEHVKGVAPIDSSYADDGGIFYTAVGWFDDAIRVLEQSVEFEPADSVSYSILGRAYISNGQMERGLAALETSIGQGYAPAHINMAIVHLMNGEPEAAKDALKNLWSRAPMFPRAAGSTLTGSEYIDLMVDGYFDPGLREEYTRYLPSVEPVSLITGSMLLKNSEHLTSWLDDSTFNRYLIITYLFAPPFRDMLNQTPMKAYINSVGLPDFWRANKWPDFCRPLGDDDFECQDVNGNYP
jgi:TolB-like protein